MKRGFSRATLNKTRVATLLGHEVCTVNAFGVRDLTEHDEEFSNFATNGDFPGLVPRREVWIDERLFENEGLFCLANALTQLAERARGVPEDRAYVAGLGAERALRERIVGERFRDGRPHARVPRRIYNRRYATLPDVWRPVAVWLVEGNLVRSLYRTDYVEGGHGYVYPWIPKGEIWTEHDLDPSEVPFIVAHEYLERRLMRDERLGYGRAHEIASKVEYELREGGGARPLVVPDGRPFRPRDLPALASPTFLDYMVMHHVRKP